jgi:hypothetical protein
MKFVDGEGEIMIICLYAGGFCFFAGFCLMGEERLFRSGDVYEERFARKGGFKGDSGEFR